MTRYSSLLLLAPLLSVALASRPSAAQGAADDIDLPRIEHVADSMAYLEIANHVTPGITVAVARNGEILFERGYGLADAEMGDAATPETVYRIGSITKQFTASIIMRLVEAGRMRLDDPITDYLPDYPTHGETITIRNLLTHTSGIKNYTSLGDTFWGVAREDLSEDELMDLFDDLPLDFEPGSDYRYSNSAFYLLGVIIGKVTGTPYHEYLESSLLQPLGLDHTLYCDNRRIVPGRAEGYDYDEDGHLVNSEYISMNNPGAAGAMCSTVGDLVRWTELLQDGNVVSPASLQAMTTPMVLTTGDTTSYGFGLGLGELQGHRKIVHGGGINGFSTLLSRYPENDVTIAVLTNSTGGTPGPIEDALARTIFGIPFEVVADLALSDQEVRRFVGQYVLHVGSTDLPLHVFEDDGALYLQPEGQSPSRLKYQGDDVFLLDLADHVQLTFSGESSRADTVTLEQGGGEFHGERVN